VPLPPAVDAGEECGTAPGEEVRKVAEGISQEGARPVPRAVALIALDPRTGEIKAVLAARYGLTSSITLWRAASPVRSQTVVYAALRQCR